VGAENTGTRCLTLTELLHTSDVVRRPLVTAPCMYNVCYFLSLSTLFLLKTEQVLLLLLLAIQYTDRQYRQKVLSDDGLKLA